MRAKRKPGFRPASIENPKVTCFAYWQRTRKKRVVAPDGVKVKGLVAEANVVYGPVTSVDE